MNKMLVFVHRIVYYLLTFLIIFVWYIGLFTLLGEWANWKGALLFFVISFIILFITGLIAYYRDPFREGHGFKVAKILKAITISIMIAYFSIKMLLSDNSPNLEIIFIYAGGLFLFFYLGVDQKIKEKLKGRRIYVWWAKRLRPEEVYSKYGIKFPNLSFELPETSGNVIVLYDDLTEDEIITQLEKGYTLLSLPEYIEQEAGLIPIEYVGNFYKAHEFTHENTFYEGLKLLLIDLILAPILLSLPFVLGYLLALLNKLFSPGPIFYSQKRMGKHGHVFTMIKFRTMIKDAEKIGGKTTSENDKRITKIGKIMRKYRLDEAPQIINILKAEMSLIGPRPERPELVKAFRKEIPHYILRFQTKPGLTGWAQVNYKYAADDIKDHIKKLEYDLYYIKHRNFYLDLLILIKTIGVVLKGEGR